MPAVLACDAAESTDPAGRGPGPWRGCAAASGDLLAQAGKRTIGGVIGIRLAIRLLPQRPDGAERVYRRALAVTEDVCRRNYPGDLPEDDMSVIRPCGWPTEICCGTGMI